jgi:hypothetical protein
MRLVIKSVIFVLADHFVMEVYFQDWHVEEIGGPSSSHTAPETMESR